MYESRDLSMWVPPLLVGLLLVGYGQGIGTVRPFENVPGLDVGFGLFGYHLTIATLLGMVAIAFVFIYWMGMEGQQEDDDMVYLPRAASAIRAITVTAILLIGWYFYSHLYTSPWDMVTSLWWLVPVGLTAWLSYVYMQNRRERASSSTAIRHTQRDVERSFESWSEVGSGTIAIFLAGFLAILSGLLAGFGNMADPLLGFAPEGAYLMTIALGYVSLGGEFAYSWLFPELSAGQFVVVTVFFGIAAMVVANR